MIDRSMKVFRSFTAVIGLPGAEYGRPVTVRARSSLEAGLAIVEGGIIPEGYVALSLVDPAG